MVFLGAFASPLSETTLVLYDTRVRPWERETIRDNFWESLASAGCVAPVVHAKNGPILGHNGRNRCDANQDIWRCLADW